MKKTKQNLIRIIRMTFLFVVTVISVSSCTDYPNNVVVDCNKMIIYKEEVRTDTTLGHYKYAITDGTTVGWTFFSNKKYNLGDTIIITKNY